MAYHHDVPLILLVRLQPREARRQVLDAYRRCGGHEERTAAEIGVSSRTLRRWTVTLGLVEEAEKLRARRRARESSGKEPAPARPGRPKKSRPAA